MATNVATDMMRSKSFQGTRSGESISQDEAPVVDIGVFTGEKKPSVERQAIREEMSSCVHDYIDSLPEKYRAVVAWNEIEGVYQSGNR